jgi:type I restriction enzyme S subunit
MMERKGRELPKGWALASIGDMIGKGGVFCDGDWVETKDQDPTGNVRLIQLADIGDGVYRNKSQRYLTREKAIALNCTFLEPNDVLIARMPDPLGRACIFPGDAKDSVTAVDVCIVRPGQNAVDSRWLMFTTNSLPIRTVIASLQSGSTRKRISRKNLGRILFPVPPLPEQERIVAKIEELFTKLDAGVEALKKIKAQLKRYRQAVLKHAFEGKLTEKWRQAHKGELEPASKLLERIAKEREKTAEGKRQKKLPPLDASDLPELPDGWEWTFGDKIFPFITSGSRGWAKYYSDIGAIFLRMGNLDHDSIKLDLRNVQRVNLPPTVEGKRTRVVPNDILISVTADVGMTALVPDTLGEAYVNQHVALARAAPSVNRAFIAWYVASREGGQRQFLKMQRGATKTGLGLDDIRNLALPVAPVSEQEKVVEEIERHFSIADQIEQTIEQGLKQSSRLRQSILKRAFEGKLVPQDPEDESAEKLLERIKAEKRRLQAAKKTGKKPSITSRTRKKDVHISR